MKKILSLVMAVLCSYIYNPIYDDLIDVNVSETVSIENDVVKVVNDKVSFYFNDNYLFSIKFEELYFESVFDYFDYLIVNGELNIVIKDNEGIRYLKYDDLGQKKIDKVYNEFINVSKVKFLYDDNYLNIIFSSNYSLESEQKLSNICVMKLDEKGNILQINTYGGELNEYLIDCYFKNKQIYVLITREKNSGGDFNNHGNFVLSIIKDEEVIGNVYFNDEIFQNIIFSECEIRIAFLGSIYAFDYDLNQVLGLKIPLESHFLITSINKMYMQIFEKELVIYDIENNKELFKYDFSDLYRSHYLRYYKILDDSLYLCFNDFIKDKYIKLDIFDTRDFVSELNYLDGISQYNNVIEGWMRKIPTTVDINSFNPAVDGEYDIVYSFLDYTKIMSVNVQEYQNVREGEIYPLAYALEFSGTAFLNGKLINYGYVISDVGNYKLEIYNANKEKRVINFSVNKNQIYFSSQTNKKSDFVLEKNQSLYLKYLIKGLNDYQIEELIINGYSYKNFNYKDNVLTITISESESGFKYYYIDKIIFKDKESNLYEKNIKEIVSVLFLNEEPSISLSYEEKKKEFILNYKLINGESIRCLKIYNGDDLLKRVDLKDGDISLKDYIKLKNVSFALVYELGDGVLYETDLFELSYNDEKIYNIANLNISSLNENLKEFTISFNKDLKLEQINIEDKIIYQKVEEDNTLFYISIVSLSLIIINRFIYVFKHRKKKNVFKINNTFKKNEIMI